MAIPRPRRSNAITLPDTTRPLLQTVESYLVASTVGAAAGTTAGPLVPGLPTPQRIDPFRLESEPFLDLVHRLVALAAASGGRVLPRWALYDCGMVPGGVFGLALPADRAPAAACKALGVAPECTRLVPLSMVIALPLLAPGAWHIYCLHALDEVLPGSAADPLRSATLVAALTVLDVRRATVVARWCGDDLSILARFVPLELVTAWTPGSTHGEVLTCRFDVSADYLADECGAPASAAAPASMTVSAEDATALRQLQDAIESGRRYEIIGPPDEHGAVPLREVDR